MKKFILLVTLLALFAQAGTSQINGIRLQRSFTTPKTGIHLELQQAANAGSTLPSGGALAPLTPGINWQATDAASIDNYVKVSSQSQETAAGWGLNNQRLSLYGNTSTPLWGFHLPSRHGMR